MSRAGGDVDAVNTRRKYKQTYNRCHSGRFKAAILQQTAQHVHSLNCKVADMTKKLVKLQKAYDSKGFQAHPCLEDNELVDVGVQTSESLFIDSIYPDALATSNGVLGGGGGGGCSSRKRQKTWRDSSSRLGSDSTSIGRPISKFSVACQTDFTDNTSVEFRYMKRKIIELHLAYDHERQLRAMRERQCNNLEINHFNVYLSCYYRKTYCTLTTTTTGLAFSKV
ncbi:hypothetical protein Tsp_01382 [Trichinella spiralis]|uniref:hypothetical protein n=1 Tax=Trichinella spiralis TaxID=6334 RepID=UPI0001EFB2CC|nr:hypothetical protein Tsp_01382 [Trichinella spiralis]